MTDRPEETATLYITDAELIRRLGARASFERREPAGNGEERKMGDQAKAKVDLTEDRLFSLGFGLVFKAVCAPSHWSPEKVADEATKMDPPGTSENRWVISTPEQRDDDFNGVNHLPCPDDCNRTHWLVNC